MSLFVAIVSVVVSIVGLEWALRLLVKFGFLFVMIGEWLSNMTLVRSVKYLVNLVLDVKETIKTLTPKRPYGIGYPHFRAPRTMRWYLHQPKRGPVEGWLDVNYLALLRGFVMMVTFRRVVNSILLCIIVLSVTIMVVGLVKRIMASKWYQLRKISKMLGGPVLFMEESLQEHSDLKSVHEMPLYQIKLSTIDSVARHVGFGIRVDSRIMIVPAHVWKKFVGTSVVLEGKNGAALVQFKEGIGSKLHADLVYVTFAESTFTKLGVKIASLSDLPANSEIATIVGHDGLGLWSTSGCLQRSTMFAMVEYSGSTKNGFSGAPYVVNNQVWGMHTGSQAHENVNMGVAAGIIKHELARIVNLEGSWSNTEETMASRMTKREDSYQDLVADAYDSYDEEDDIVRYNRQKKMFKGENLTAGAVEALAAINKLSGAETRTIFQHLYMGQTTDGEELVDPAVKRELTISEKVSRNNKVINELWDWADSIDEKLKSVFGRISTLESDVQELRKKALEQPQKDKSELLIQDQEKEESKSEIPVEPISVKPLGPPNPNKTVKCSECNRWFKTETYMQIHRATHINEESAFGFDNKNVVRLQKKPVFRNGNLPPRRRQNLKNTSNSSEGFVRLEQHMANLSKQILALTQKIG